MLDRCARPALVRCRPNPASKMTRSAAPCHVDRARDSIANSVMAKGGIEPPTQGFSGRPGNFRSFINQTLATYAEFREQSCDVSQRQNMLRKVTNSLRGDPLRSPDRLAVAVVSGFRALAAARTSDRAPYAVP